MSESEQERRAAPEQELRLLDPKPSTLPRRDEAPTRIMRWMPLGAAVALATVAALAALITTFGGGASALVPVAPARMGELVVSVVETGTLEAARAASYSSRIQGNKAKIIALAPEGKLVEKGDLLILFDATPFEEEIRKSRAQLAQADADLALAAQDEKIQQIRNAEETHAAEEKVAQSRLSLEDLEKGSGRLREVEAAAEVRHAEREVQEAEANYADLEPLLAAGFITRLELERARQQVERAGESLDLARMRHAALDEYGRPLELSRARSEALTSRETLRQTGATARHRLEQRRAAISAARSRIDEAAANLALAQQQLALTEVRTDVPGIVVYRKLFRGSERRKPQVGDQVWANQPLLILPDVSKMLVETQVRETDLHKLMEGQTVRIGVDAFPELRLTGRVKLIGTLAQARQRRRGSKFFNVTVEVNESDPRLRPGMTARVTIEASRHTSVLSVPVDAIFEITDEPHVYVRQGREFEARRVQLGESNEDFIIIRNGLEPGEQVALRDPALPPSDFSRPPDA